MVMPDTWIRKRCIEDQMIDPFVDWEYEGQRGTGKISYGLTSYGYDVRCGRDFRVFHNLCTTVVDPKQFDERGFTKLEDEEACIIPPNSFVLAQSYEYIRVPRHVSVLCVGKSTYARCGIIANVTPLEAEWEGHITIELSNTTPSPAKIYAMEGIVQLVFFRGDSQCAVSYKDKKGKYQCQQGITLPKV